MIDAETLRRATGCSHQAAAIYAEYLREACAVRGINTRERLAAFLAQIAHESGALRYTLELADGWAYEGRANLGNTQAGDGPRYRGRGLLQITGRDNYRRTARRMADLGAPDFEAEPDTLLEPRWAMLSAADWWHAHGCNELADRGALRGIGRLINRGNAAAQLPANGEEDRMRRWELANAVLEDAALRAPEIADEPGDHAQAALPPHETPAPPAADPALAPWVRVVTAPVQQLPPATRAPSYAPANNADDSPDWPELASAPAAAEAPDLSTPNPNPTTEEPTMAPLLAGLGKAIILNALPQIVQAIPRLGAIFGAGASETAQRNVKALEVVADTVAKAVGARNAQETIEALQDPARVRAARAAIDGVWAQIGDLVEAGGGGVDGARKADAEARAGADRFWYSPSFWMGVLLLPLVYMIVASLIGLLGTAEWSADTRAALAGSIVGAIVGGLVGYYFGFVTSRNRPTSPTPQ
jgi:putative chitinase